MPDADPTPIPTPEIALPSWIRTPEGLLPGINYERNSDGSINWRKMVKPEFLVVNKQSFEKRKEVPPDSIEGLEDKDLLILLGGIKDLARLRGYTSVRHTPITTNPQYCSVRTTIHWIPNFETSGLAVEFDALADASPQNTTGFAKLYLAAIAENRGFVRAVRNFLGINISGQDEVGPVVEEDNAPSSGKHHDFLKGILTKNNIKFENFKNRMIEQEVKGASDWESIADVPSETVLEVVDIVQKLLEKAKKKS